MIESLWFSIIFVIIGIVFLYGGAECLVWGSRSIALLFGIRPLIVGLTVVAFATSSPELFVSIQGTLADQGDLVIGNIIGSNIANIGLILAISALIQPLEIHWQIFRFDLPVLLLASLFVVGCGWGESVHRWQGVFLLGGSVFYTLALIYLAKKEKDELKEPVDGSTGMAVAAILFGLLFLVGGAWSLVEGAVTLAKAFGVRESLIGLTLVAVGTSLPELAASFVAAYRKEGDLVIGNVMGSNIYNLLLILGVAATLHPLELRGVGLAPLWINLFFTLALLPVMRTRGMIHRWEGAFLLIAYALGIFWLWNN